MIFYVSLIVTSVLVAAVVVMIYRTMADVTRRTRRAILPSIKDDRRVAAVDGVALTRASVSKQATPWGWKRSRGVETKKSVGVPVHANERRSTVGWPYREEPFSFGEQSLGQVAPGKKVIKARKVSKGGVEKPWGW